ncbi:hypothetical protein GFS24_25940 [Chitinophaga sp. SYP-B3965]|uniref:hypothetical protein n=1 Tax=Chitinophaga sp. SYP-B3965 TaxID=2663120 RepID=UPI001299525A|nr:hypothetical protein [Chitinophaga sp. SYP-B3965]MRG48585.1 hypothetical protein [Chitinophaga sp. SYP-B3965]
MIHLTDMEIQEYVLDKATCSPDIVAHMKTCDTCREVAGAYEVLFVGMKAQEAAVFDFDVSALVLRELHRKERKPIPVFAMLISILCAGGCYFFRNDIYGLFTGIPPLLLYFIIVSTAAVALFLLADMYKGYQQKMTILNRF